MIENMSEFVLSNEISIRKSGKEYYLLKEGKCFKINETSAIILKYIGCSMDIEEFSERIAKKYECIENKEIILSDVMEYMELLEKNGIINRKK